MYVKNKYDYKIEVNTLILYLNQLKNNIYKLLPLREENKEWKKYLNSLLELEIKSFDKLFVDINFIKLIIKLESLYSQNFYLFRKGIFESLKIIDDIIIELQQIGDTYE